MFALSTTCLASYTARVADQKQVQIKVFHALRLLNVAHFAQKPCTHKRDVESVELRSCHRGQFWRSKRSEMTRNGADRLASLRCQAKGPSWAKSPGHRSPHNPKISGVKAPLCPASPRAPAPGLLEAKISLKMSKVHRTFMMENSRTSK